MLGKGDGTFQPEVLFPSGPNPQAIAVADFNGDGKPDLAIVGQVQDAKPPSGDARLLVQRVQFAHAERSQQCKRSCPKSSGPFIAPGSLTTISGRAL